MLQPSRFCQLTPGGHGGRRDSLSSALCHVMFAAFDVLFDRLFHHFVELAVFLDRDALQLLDQIDAEPLPLADAGDALRGITRVLCTCAFTRLCIFYFSHLCTFCLLRVSRCLFMRLRAFLCWR